MRIGTLALDALFAGSFAALPKMPLTPSAFACFSGAGGSKPGGASTLALSCW